jgi:hypothetical protein
MPSHRTGVLIIRAWVEEGSDEPLRAHVRVVNDVAMGVAQTSNFVKAEGVNALVLSWLREMVEDRPQDAANQ